MEAADALRRVKTRGKSSLAKALTRSTGFYLTRHPPVLPPYAERMTALVHDPVSREQLRVAQDDAGLRLMRAPTFILSGPRSGSTLLRLMLNAHSSIHAPHEINLREIHAAITHKYAVQAMWEIGLDQRALQELLWDRLLHVELMRSHKSRFVNKTPRDAFIWPEIVHCWPDARFIFLLRHPLAVANSWHAAHPDWSTPRVQREVLSFLEAVEDARTLHGGLTVRYEDLTAAPEAELRRICEFIGVAWEASMLDYGRTRDPLVTGLGDWSDNIRSGTVQPAKPLPQDADVPSAFRAICRQWQYLEGD